MIKSTKVTLKFLNRDKKKLLDSFIDEYNRVVTLYVDLFWEMENIPRWIDKSMYSKIDTWISKKASSAAGKHASGIVRGVKRKQQKRLWQINKLKSEGKFIQALKLQEIYDSIILSKPKINNVTCELNSQFILLDLDNKTSFDGWLTLKFLGNKKRIIIPFKKHRHFNKLLLNGKIKGGVRLDKNNITFNFEIENNKSNLNGNVLGIDVGQINTISCSDGQILNTCPHGHTYKSICDKLARKKRGSKNFKKVQTHRSNYLRYIVNKLNLEDVSVVNRENITGLRKKRLYRSLSHWNYAELFAVLDNKLIETGVQINKLNPAFTSRRCSVCGWTCEDNRKGRLFKCEKCGYTTNSDLNASINLSLCLKSLDKQTQLKQSGKTGFYWNVLSKEFTVPCVRKVNMINNCPS